MPAEIMAIVNVTPDSFYPASRWGTEDSDLDNTVRHCLQLVEEGASILDIGGESTRPGSQYISSEEEIRRVVPLIQALRQRSQVAISIDTRKRTVAEAAFKAGAQWVNDISALKDDATMGPFIAESGMKVVLMHKKGEPGSMQNHPHYEGNVVTEVFEFLQAASDLAHDYGILDENIFWDPGIGFGKNLTHNLALLRNLKKLAAGKFPLVLGVSRKRFIQDLTRAGVEDRLAGSLVTAVWAELAGAKVLRVHDVAATLQALQVSRALWGEGN